MPMFELGETRINWRKNQSVQEYGLLKNSLSPFNLPSPYDDFVGINPKCGILREAVEC